MYIILYKDITGKYGVALKNYLLKDVYDMSHIKNERISTRKDGGVIEEKR